MDICLIQDEEADKILRIIRSWMMEYSIKPAKKDMFYEEGLVRNIMIRKGFKTNEVMVVLVTTDKRDSL